MYQTFRDGGDAIQGFSAYISGETGTSFSATWVLSINWFEVPAFGGSPDIVSEAIYIGS